MTVFNPHKADTVPFYRRYFWESVPMFIDQGGEKTNKGDWRVKAGRKPGEYGILEAKEEGVSHSI